MTDTALDRRSHLLVCIMPMLRAYVRTLVRDRDMTNDVLQEVSLRILTSDPPDDDAGRFLAWSRGVARFVVARERRRRHRNGAELVPGGALPETPDTTRDPERRADVSQRLGRAIDDLDHRSVELLVRRYLLEETAEELAAELSQTPSALRMRLMRLRSLLREESD